MEQDTSNLLFQLAGDLVKNTSRHIFLTGKAGTGKTTFLRYIKDNSFKKSVVVAPTGVAAINAGGVTIHSFFQLPIGPFVPGTKNGFSENGATDKHGLLSTIKIGGDKRRLFQELELLIIDEVSMVRCDTLDAVDLILRHFRKRWSEPFGGVQVLYIGDMYQLPPVVPDDDWRILRDFYSGPFFFDSVAFNQSSVLYIELDKVYRQTDQSFIDILNRVRNNIVRPEDWKLLNGLYDPEFFPSAEDNYVTLTTHNNKADAINAYKLRQLSGETFIFKGDIVDEFPDKAFPTDLMLHLKIGAQVMFVKNDSSPVRRYYNGKLGTIKNIKGDDITITFPHERGELELSKETWKNIRYTYDKASGNIDEQELGTFTQYPIRLAWAITIHKSQGLTFEKAIIDAGETFAPGQLYTALSRCTSLEGIVLYSKLASNNIISDQRIVAFGKRVVLTDELQRLLNLERQNFWSERIIQLFDFTKLLDPAEEFKVLVNQTKLADRKAAAAIALKLVETCYANHEIAGRFATSLKQLFQKAIDTSDYTAIEDRVSKAIEYFTNAFRNDCLLPLEDHIRSLEYAVGIKGYLTEARNMALGIREAINSIRTIKFGDKLIYQAPAIAEPLPALYTQPKRKKAVKGASTQVSYKLFREGKTIDAIAKLRNISPTTVEIHLSDLIVTGEVDIYELVPETKLPIILEALNKFEPSLGLSTVKEALGDNFTYGEIRAALSYRNKNDHKPA